jgi:hypothetical protein
MWHDLLLYTLVLQALGTGYLLMAQRKKPEPCVNREQATRNTPTQR